jgi:hypothetical protein
MIYGQKLKKKNFPSKKCKKKKRKKYISVGFEIFLFQKKIQFTVVIQGVKMFRTKEVNNKFEEVSTFIKKKAERLERELIQFLQLTEEYPDDFDRKRRFLKAHNDLADVFVECKKNKKNRVSFAKKVQIREYVSVQEHHQNPFKRSAGNSSSLEYRPGTLSGVGPSQFGPSSNPTSRILPKQRAQVSQPSQPKSRPKDVLKLLDQPPVKVSAIKIFI